MRNQDDRLIAVRRVGCVGCSCYFAGATGPAAGPGEGGAPSDPIRLVGAALLAFGAPLLLLLLGAAGAALFTPGQPAWALGGLVPLLGIAAGGCSGLRKALLPLALRSKTRPLWP